MTEKPDTENEAPNPEFEAFDALVKRIANVPPETVRKALDAENEQPKKRGRPRKQKSG